MIRKIMMLGMLVAGLALFGCTTPGGGNGKAKTKTKLDPIESKIFQGQMYDEEGQILTLQFNSGSVYRYSEVPKDVYEKFMAAENKGDFFQSNILNKYVGRYIED